jgi:hypothetical protein
MVMIRDFLLPEADNVHVWLLSLDLPEAELRRLGRLLSADEAARAERFVHISDRGRYVAAHGSSGRLHGHESRRRCVP